MEDVINKSGFLGRGWSFPPQFSKTERGLVMSAGPVDIRESLNILLSTMQGERIFEIHYGCDLSPLLYESLTLSTKTTLSEKIHKAIVLYEPRIKVEHIDFESNVYEGVVYIHVTYIIRSTNTRTNIVYPYYLKEGTEL
ncbi:MAG: GPW/gp25 family protein [Bacteroidetes bacterium]|nr:MAG: GPW/gp25 family protein [Bacteroidota bacterium]